MYKSKLIYSVCVMGSLLGLSGYAQSHQFGRSSPSTSSRVMVQAPAAPSAFRPAQMQPSAAELRGQGELEYVAFPSMDRDVRLQGYAPTGTYANTNATGVFFLAPKGTGSYVANGTPGNPPVFPDGSYKSLDAQGYNTGIPAFYDASAAPFQSQIGGQDSLLWRPAGAAPLGMSGQAALQAPVGFDVSGAMAAWNGAVPVRSQYAFSPYSSGDVSGLGMRLGVPYDGRYTYGSGGIGVAPEVGFETGNQYAIESAPRVYGDSWGNGSYAGLDTVGMPSTALYGYKLGAEGAQVSEWYQGVPTSQYSGSLYDDRGSSVAPDGSTTKVIYGTPVPSSW